MKINHLFMAILVLSFTIMSCKDGKKNDENSEEQETEEVEQASEEIVYEAVLTALNSNVTQTETEGKATFIVKDGAMEVTIEIRNAPADMQHWQHFHGFENGDAADCVSTDQDENGDGIVDVVETEAVSGTTMVPFHDLPVEMNIPTDTYPTADEDGNYLYEATLNLEDLESAFADAFDGQEINLDSRVLYIHGVPGDTELPDTVQSIGDIPPQVTLPIACGKIVKISQ